MEHRIRQGLQAGLGGDRVEARRQPISEWDEPQLAQVEEPGFPALERARRGSF
jgi:hypothetical protein